MLMSQGRDFGFYFFIIFCKTVQDEETIKFTKSEASAWGRQQQTEADKRMNIFCFFLCWQWKDLSPVQRLIFCCSFWERAHVAWRLKSKCTSWFSHFPWTCLTYLYLSQTFRSKAFAGEIVKFWWKRVSLGEKKHFFFDSWELTTNPHALESWTAILYQILLQVHWCDTVLFTLLLRKTQHQNNKMTCLEMHHKVHHK